MNRLSPISAGRLAVVALVLMMAPVLVLKTNAQTRINFVDDGQRLGGNANSSVVALGDLDGEGDLDAVVAVSGGPNKLWLNEGNGTFSESGQNLEAGAVSVALGDPDGTCQQSLHRTVKKPFLALFDGLALYSPRIQSPNLLPYCL